MNEGSRRSTSPRRKGGQRRRARSRTPPNIGLSHTQLVQEPTYLMVAVERGRNLALPNHHHSMSGDDDDSNSPSPYAIVEHGNVFVVVFYLREIDLLFDKNKH